MSKVALVQGTDRYRLITHALNLIDEDIASKLRGKAPCTVLLKPNMVRTDQPLAATHVDALRAILDYLQKYENSIKKIIIGEGPAGAPAEEGFRNYGYLDLLDAYAVDFLDLNRDAYKPIPILQIDGGMRAVRVAQTPLDSEFKISVTLPKTHETVIFSGATKNFVMGSVIWDTTDDKIMVHGFANRREWDHYYPRAIKMLHKNLVTLLRVLKPDLAVIDGLVAMEGNGPVSGTSLSLGVGIAGTDPIATDAVAVSVMGFKPSEIGYLYYANRDGLGTAELSEIDVVGAKIEDVVTECTPHANIDLERTWSLTG
ncbi:hypothetical protein AC480_03450 [miscellaneous Crenarchaeota group archaeon SMTZ1-55]|nr:MAG: hypothetical protein AC480_03450 [miscellaneous Crenarchaeota group archaeon SMTZ1-55]